ncbi:solute carrier organic anion transporter family member 4A1-like isoform X2 [Dendronephthya gigantea]|nr:solute carrier organic anion transporter family member 4A1-like isoform X2 [Dendronephthya gigantea]
MDKTKDATTVSIRRRGDEHRTGKFGYFGCNPSFLQWMNCPWVMLILIILGMIAHTCAIVGVLATVLPHMEKRFNLSSFDSGMIAAANDVPAVIFGLFVAHWGHFSNKVRWIGVGGIITAVGLVINAIPHFIIGEYKPPLPQNILCGLPPGFAPPITNTTPVNGTGGGGPPTACDSGDIAERYHLALILIGQFIAGVGSIPLFAFPPALFRETMKEKHMPMALAFWQVSVFIGPMMAFAFSEPLLETWVDITEPKGLNLTPQDPRWISAWWIGFLGPAGLSFLVGVINLGMPEHISSQLNDAEIEEIKRIDDKERDLTLKEKVLKIPKILGELLTNWTFVFNSLAFNSTLMFAEGLAPFIAKILILRFGVKIQDVGKVLNISIVPPLVLGVLFSIFLLRVIKIENSGRKSALICFLLHFAGVFPPIATLLSGCDNVNLAGYSVDYGIRNKIGNEFHLNKTFPSIPGYPLGSTCNENCKCGLESQVPVCGTDGVSYLNPCFAGCKLPSFTEKLTFTNCSCIPSDDGYGGKGKIGFCDANCKNWLAFLAMISVFSLATFTQLAPSKVVVVRAVKAEHLSFAFALHYLSNKVLANIPGPIIFGHIVDLSCDIWQKVCGKTGFCMIYDMDDLMTQCAIIVGTLCGIGLLCYFITWLVYKEAEPVAVKREFELNNPGYQSDSRGDGVNAQI